MPDGRALRGKHDQLRTCKAKPLFGLVEDLLGRDELGRSLQFERRTDDARVFIHAPATVDSEPLPRPWLSPGASATSGAQVGHQFLAAINVEEVHEEPEPAIDRWAPEADCVRHQSLGRNEAFSMRSP